MHATLTLFGRFQMLVDGAPVTFVTEHGRALLAYLAMQPGAHERAVLAALLWPERPEAKARQNLRQTLVHLKKSLRPFPQLNMLLVVTPKSIALQAATIATDAQDFNQLWAACAAHTHSQLATCEECIARLQKAAQLYTGEFLHGFFVKSSPRLEEWILFSREQFHRQVLEILDTLTRHDEQMADYSQMQHNARRQLALEPWGEEAHLQLMRALALSGQSIAALAHYVVCQRIFAEELGVPPSAAITALYEQIKRGEFDGAMRRFEGGSADERVKTQRWSKQSREETTEISHPFPTRLPAPYNLPSPLTPFIGREQEVDELMQLLGEPETRLLTLVGLGGIGKTRLAIEAAQKLYALYITKPQATKPLVNPDFSDGLFFAALAPLSSSTALPAAIAATLGVDLGIALGNNPHQAVLNYLRNKALLLILDNFEHLLDGVSLIIELLEQAPRVKILVTSRERLNLRVEQLYPVPPLTHARQGKLAEATTWPAVRLFAERARRVSPNFKATESNLPALLRICGLVQGMPLGLEMAAARCNVLSLDEIAAAIERSVDFLAVDYYDLPERQHSMRAVFDWSWRLLAEDEALVLRQLSVFRGGFTRQAAEIICGATLRILNGLVNKSVLRRSLDTSENPGIATGRYEFHPLLWQFAQEKLTTHSEEMTKSATRHSDYYLAFVAERERRLMRHEPRQAMMEIQAELDNVRQAWRWAVDHAAGKTLDLGAYGLWQFYPLAGLTAEAVAAFGQAVTTLMRSAAEGQAASTAQRYQPILSKLYAIFAHLLSLHGNYDEAIVNAQHSITLAAVEQTEATSLHAAALGRLAMGQALYNKSQFSESQTYLEQVLQAVQDEITPNEIGDEIWPDISVSVRLYLGAIARTQGDYALAYSYLADALRLCQMSGKLRAEARVQMNLGVTARFMRDEQRARQAYEQVLPLTIELHDRWGEGVARHELAEVVRELGEYSLALTLCQQALSIFVDIDERLGQAHSLAELIELSTYLGEFEQANTYQVQLANLLQQLKSPDAERESLVASAVLAHYQGDDARSLNCAEHLWQLVQPMNSPIFQAETLILLGQAQSGLSLQVAAVESYTQALTLYQSLNALAQAAEAQAGLAALALAQGDHTRALQFIESALVTLEQYPNAGLYEPFSIYLTGYRVLVAMHDPRARTLLKRAYALLQSYAAHIDNEALRDSFLQNVRVHRQLVAVYEEAANKASFEKVEYRCQT